jgi:serine protease Do
VTLVDERSFKAKIVGTDPKTDVAVVKIDADGLRPGTLGDSDKLKVGEWVIAAGNPFALTSTITAGIVSAKGRSNVGIVDYEDFIQTDAAINPGNSGGPLVNLRGEVVGINTAIFSQSGGYSGIGFAIPSNMANSVMKSLIEKGRVIRGYLGVAIQNLTEGLAKSFGYDGTDGVLISEVTPQGPADKAGLKQGEIITRFDGRAIKDTVQLRSLVAATQPDRTVQVEVIRGGRKEIVAVKIGELESKQVQKQSEPPQSELGMRVETLTPEIAQQLGRADLRGVIVTSIDPLGAAAKAGIRTYDVVLDVQGRSVASVAEFERELKKYDLKKGVRLRVQSGEMQHFVFIVVQ